MLDMPVRKLINAWKGCVGLAKIARPMVEDELRAAERAHVRVTSHILTILTDLVHLDLSCCFTD